MIEVVQSEEFIDWLASLRDKRAKTVVNTRIVRIGSGLLGDTKSIGEGVSEFRIDYAAGYRLYYTWIDKKIVFLLAGGDKSSQTRDIERARLIASNFRKLH